MTDLVITHWTAENRGEFRRGVTAARHRLNQAQEFTDFALAELIERHPGDLLEIRRKGGEGGAAPVKPGDGMDLLDAVRSGRACIQLREAMSRDAAYKPMFESLIAQLRRLNPGLHVFGGSADILISGPGAHLAYRADFPEVSLFQVKGRQRVFVYPPYAPWLDERKLERALLGAEDDETAPPPEWEIEAAVRDLEGGTLLSWPLNAPYCAETLADLNVSVVLKMDTFESVMRTGVLHANALLRRIGYSPRSSGGTGLGAMIKLAISQSWRLGTAIARRPAARPAPVFETATERDMGEHATA
ncbi:hypothetical protein DDZ18_12040 [Marinicauda salina]|uniref:Uncharacterized protein n=1 Tax=Marinicauda salina TaxID=2135793 RepID=A0A2U2BR68_9PROT|nr:hypothetical protein [Marinicauda salina]PWE16496.1 hypothetical protein DDZ18_12040 [Marinicauda salina]